MGCNMDRRKFLEKFMAFGAGITLNFVVPWAIKNSTLYTEEELKEINLDSISVYELEKRIMFDSLLLQNNPKKLVEVYDEGLNKLKITEKLQPIILDIKDFYVKKFKEFMERGFSREKIEAVNKELSTASSEIVNIKKNENLGEIVRIKRIPILNLLGVPQYDEVFVEDYFKFNSFEDAINSIVKERYTKTIYEMYKTLERLAPDALFIQEASKITDIPIRHFSACNFVESRGKRFIFGGGLEVTGLQFHPKYLVSNFKVALAQNNELTDYIMKNAPKKFNLIDIVENLTYDNKLTIAVGFNYIKYLSSKYQDPILVILAYNLGEKVRNLPKSFLKKLKNPYDLDEKDLNSGLKKAAYFYYKEFVEAEEYFKVLEAYIN